MPTKKIPAKTVAKSPAKKVSTVNSAKKVAAQKSDVGTPLSVVIRRRIEAQKARFHANDNISKFIQPGELDGLVDEVAEKMQAVLESLVIDTDGDHNTKNTSQRVAKMFVKEVFNGRYIEQPTLTKFPNVSRLNELMIIGPITVRSACSHHLCPIMGRIWIGVLPSKESALIGLSKYSRLQHRHRTRPVLGAESLTSAGESCASTAAAESQSALEHTEALSAALSTAAVQSSEAAESRSPLAHAAAAASIRFAHVSQCVQCKQMDAHRSHWNEPVARTKLSRRIFCRSCTAKAS
jgi:GTP cyclohydrolase I